MIIPNAQYRFWQRRNIFSDEAHFDLGKYVNKQNCRIWGTENPHAYIEKPTHPKHTVPHNGDRYRAILNKFLFTKIEEEDVGNIWFQQDSAKCHTPNSDLILLDSFLWGADKNKCYADKRETIDALKDNVREALSEIQLLTIDNVLKNWNGRSRVAAAWPSGAGI